MKTSLILLMTLFLNHPAFAAEEAERINISNFSTEQLGGWKTKKFNHKTDYRLVQMDGKTVLKASSANSASGLVKKQRIDLYKTPFLNWSWRIENRLGKMNEQQKSGDDYVARVYVIIDGGWIFWDTKAINYVWSSNTAKGEIWPNAFAGDHAMMIAVRDATDPLNTWKTEKRNVLKDLQRFYGDRIRYIDGIALMTDTDNHKGQATAYYSDIYFSKN